MAITKVTSSVVGSGSATDGYVLTSDGSGNSAWEAVAGGPTFKTFGTDSIMIGDTTTGTIDAANYNVGLGVDVFAALTSADNNVAVGFAAGTALTTGNNNTFVGANAGDANTTGSSNSGIGKNALGATTTGIKNSALGHAALLANTTASDNVAMGWSALTANTTGTANTAVGTSALAANTTGEYNDASGFSALTANTTGSYNTAHGANALATNTGGSSNTAVGYAAMYASNNGTLVVRNTAVGHTALYQATADDNSAFGYAALRVQTTGSRNTAIGNQAGYAVTTGTDNTFLGLNAALTLTTGARNTVIGRSANTGATTNDTIVIGYNVSQAGNGYVSMGSGGTTVYIPLTGSTTSWSATSDERLKTNVGNFNVGLDFINNLNPITFNWKKKGEVDSTLTSVYEENSEDFVRGWDNSTHVGFLAQAIKEQVDAFNLPNGVKLWQEDSDGIQGVADGELIPMFVNAIKELSAKNDALEARLTALEG